MAWVFWISVAFVLYTLVGYQTLVRMISLVRRKNHVCKQITPPVTIIVVAHNEGETIGEKIRNTLAFDYPRERLEVVVGSDASTDDTSEVVRSYESEGVKLVESLERKGKHAMQFQAVQAAVGEIIVFTDASIRVDPGILLKMISHFADPAIGCVSSVDQKAEAQGDWKSEHLYVSGEMGLRLSEARIGSTVSLSGSFFAVRRPICDGWHEKMSSDFFLALHAVERGYRAVIDADCPARVGAVKSQKAEMRRKIRTIVHGLIVFFSHLQLLNFFRYGLFSWQLISHKLFRWLLPFGFLAVLFSNALLWNAGIFYRATLVVQLVGYSFALLPFVHGRLAKAVVVKLATFFVIGNVATLVAWWDFILGEELVFWEPSRRG